jgi:hypothetical protein
MPLELSSATVASAIDPVGNSMRCLRVSYWFTRRSASSVRVNKSSPRVRRYFDRAGILREVVDINWRELRLLPSLLINLYLLP